VEEEAKERLVNLENGEKNGDGYVDMVVRMTDQFNLHSYL